MDHASLHRLIRQKLDDGRLQHNSIPRVWGGPGNGEACDACEEPVAKALKEYQKSQNLAMTGTMNADTAAKLGMKR